MAQKPPPGPLPCAFCGKIFAATDALTTHLDLVHANWVDDVLARLGLNSPGNYPIAEYRRAIVEAFLTGDSPVPSVD